MKKMLQTLRSWLVMGAILWGAYAFIGSVAAYFKSLNSDVAKALVAAGAAIVGSTITITVGKAYETRATTAKDLRAKKAPVYEAIVEGAFRVLFAPMLGIDKPDELELKKYFVKTTESLSIWGSNSVVKAFGKFKAGTSDPANALFLFEDLMFAMRHDLGHSGTLSRASLLRFFVNDIDEYLAGRQAAVSSAPKDSTRTS